MQALEAIKIVSGVGKPMGRKMLVMDAAEGRMMMVGLRARSPSCVACGSGSEEEKDGDSHRTGKPITADTISTYDYGEFTGQVDNDGPPVPLVLLEVEDRVTVEQLKQRLSAATAGTVEQSNNKVLLIDVRPLEQYKIFRLPGAVHAPWGRTFDDCVAQHMGGDQDEEREVIVYCRRGNDSQRAVQRLKILWEGKRNGDVKDMVGGIEAWAKEVDEDFPIL